jgi:nucleoside-diphosphate-sugar epimerase
MKCLVTGVAGFIGSHLAEALIEDGHSVVGVDCFTDYYSKSRKLSNIRALRKQEQFKFLQLDLSRSNIGRLQEPDVVFHLAAQPGVRASWGASFAYYVRDNISATQRLLEVAKSWGVKKFIYASSSSVYGDSERLPTSEDAMPRPVSPYGTTKLAAEHLCHVYHRSFGVPTVVLRYFTVYGPRQRPDMAFSKFIDRIRRGRPVELFGDGRQERDFTFVGDTVRGTLLAIAAPAGETYNVGTGRPVQLLQVVSLLESIMMRKANVKVVESARGDVAKTCADISKLKASVGYRPLTRLEDGLKLQVDARPV